ncbi:MAG: epoxyqueuosine reductase QueH [Salinivirgaceae bacterium]|nr:epoxyqueuosine reductase QueH [Salinivirgaceae bacterium]
MEQKILKLDVPFGEKKVLLHACCAPCSSAIVECMLKNDIKPTIFYCNPNIYPQSEYLIRKNECTRFAQDLGLEIVDDDYNHDQWLKTALPLADEPERGQRCLQCFKHRLLRTAQYAAQNGYRIITTTLASSRWKSLEQINEAGEWAAAQTGVTFWTQNWRKGGLSERRTAIIKQYNFYEQKYCGCEFSMKKG